MCNCSRKCDEKSIVVFEIENGFGNCWYCHQFRGEDEDQYEYEPGLTLLMRSIHFSPHLANSILGYNDCLQLVREVRCLDGTNLNIFQSFESLEMKMSRNTTDPMSYLRCRWIHWKIYAHWKSVREKTIRIAGC